MAIANIFTTTTSPESPLDASRGTETKSTVSDFLTVQSFTNFAAMTGAITAAWSGLQKLIPEASTLWVPYVCAFIWALISILISIDGLRTITNSSKKLQLGTILQAIFIGVYQLAGLGRCCCWSETSNNLNSLGRVCVKKALFHAPC